MIKRVLFFFFAALALCAHSQPSSAPQAYFTPADINLKGLQGLPAHNLDILVDSIYNSLPLNHTLNLKTIFDSLQMGDIYKAIDLEGILKRLDWNAFLKDVDWNLMLKDFNWNMMVGTMCNDLQSNPPASPNPGYLSSGTIDNASIMKCLQPSMQQVMAAINQPCLLQKMTEGKIKLSSTQGDIEGFCAMAECIDFAKYFKGMDWNCFFRAMDLNTIFQKIDYGPWIEQMKTFHPQEGDSAIQLYKGENPILKQLNLNLLKEQIGLDTSILKASEHSAIFQNLYNNIIKDRLLLGEDSTSSEGILLLSFSMIKSVFQDSRALRYYIVHLWLLYESSVTIRSFRFTEALKILENLKDILIVAYREGMFDTLKGEVGDVRTIIGRLYEPSNLAGLCQELAMVNDQLGHYSTALDYLNSSVAIRKSIIQQLPGGYPVSELLNEHYDESARQALMAKYGINLDVLKPATTLLLYSKHPPIIEKLLNQKRFEEAIEVYLLFKDLLLIDSRNNRVLPDFVLKNKLIDRTYALKMVKKIYGNMARVLMQAGQQDSLRQQKFLDAQPILEKFEEEQWLAVLYSQMGQTYSLTGNYEYSLKYFKEAWELLKRIENLDYIVIAYPGTEASEKEFLNKMPLYVLVAEQMASIYVNRKRYVEAEAILKEAVDVLSQKKFIGFEKGSAGYEDNLFRIYGTLSEVQLLKGNFAGAATHLQKCATIAERAGSQVLKLDYLLYQGNFQRYTGHPREAALNFEQALVMAREMGYRYGEATVMGNLGAVYMQLGKKEEALKLYTSTEEIAQALYQYRLLLDVYTLQGLFWQNEGEYEKALEWFNKGIGVLESSIFSFFQGNSSRQLSIERASQCYAGAVSVSLQLGQKGKAYEYVRQTQARTLNELLQEGILQQKTGLSKTLDTLKVKKQDILAQLNINSGKLLQASRLTKPDSTYQKDLQKTLLQQLEYVNAQIREQLNDSITHKLTPSIHDIQLLLKPGEALVEFFTGQSIVAFVLTKDSFEVVPLGAVGQGSKRISKFMKNLDALIDKLKLKKTDLLLWKGMEEVSLTELYETFWKPIEETGLLKDVRKLILIPDADLYLIPFDALATRGSRTGYLADYFEINYYPSSNTFYQYELPEKNTPSFSKDLLVIAKSDFKEYKNLGALSIPARDPLYGLFPKVDFLIEDAAHIDTLLNRMLEEYRYLYVSTHGIIDSVPELSYLAMDELPLSLYQTFELKLASKVVVLSACETAKGEFQRGAGIMGFTRGLLHAGAQSLVVSLWEVEEKATEQLMLFFFQGLSAGLSPSEALTQAKLQLRKVENGKYNHPYYWGAFVLFGNGG